MPTHLSQLDFFADVLPPSDADWHPCAACGRRRKLSCLRRLCRRCTKRLEVREKYGDDPRLVRCRQAPPIPRPLKEPTPTEHMPGTPGKVEELARRLWSGERLWSKDDAPGRVE